MTSKIPRSPHKLYTGWALAVGLLASCGSADKPAAADAAKVASDAATTDGPSDTAITCTAPKVACGASCADTQADPLHCGACGKACGDKEVCSAGKCTAGCPSGTTNCSGACVNTGSDAVPVFT